MNNLKSTKTIETINFCLRHIKVCTISLFVGWLQTNYLVLKSAFINSFNL